MLKSAIVVLAAAAAASLFGYAGGAVLSTETGRIVVAILSGVAVLSLVLQTARPQRPPPRGVSNIEQTRTQDRANEGHRVGAVASFEALRVPNYEI